LLGAPQHLEPVEVPVQYYSAAVSGI